MAAFTLNVNMDCADIDRMTRFWSAALGYEVTGELGPFRALRDQVMTQLATHVAEYLAEHFSNPQPPGGSQPK